MELTRPLQQTRPVPIDAGLNSLAHALMARMDRIMALLEQGLLAGQLAQQGELAPVVSPGAYMAQPLGLLRILVANTIPASPETTRDVTVGTTETALVENNSAVLLRVEITNLDPAQPLWVSGKGVLTTAGQIILPRSTTPFVVPIGKSLWGICAVATITVGVSEGIDIFNQVESLGGTEWMKPQS